MNIKRIVILTVAVGLGMAFFSGIWHNLILASFYGKTGAEHEGIAVLFIAYFILAFLMSYLYPRFYKGGKPVIEGMKFGALIGILWVFPHELAMVGAHGEPLEYVFKNGALHIFEQGFGGIILGYLHEKLK